MFNEKVMCRNIEMNDYDETTTYNGISFIKIFDEKVHNNKENRKNN